GSTQATRIAARHKRPALLRRMGDLHRSFARRSAWQATILCQHQAIQAASRPSAAKDCGVETPTPRPEGQSWRLQCSNRHAQAFLWPQLACNLAMLCAASAVGLTMSRVIVLILCLASAAGIAGYTYFFSNRGEPTAVYVVAQRPPEPKPKPAAATNIDPND